MNDIVVLVGYIMGFFIGAIMIIAPIAFFVEIMFNSRKLVEKIINKNRDIDIVFNAKRYMGFWIPSYLIIPTLISYETLYYRSSVGDQT